MSRHFTCNLSSIFMEVASIFFIIRDSANIDIMVNQSSISSCERLSTIKPGDEWWFYQCGGGVPKDTTGMNTEDDIREILSHLQVIFNNEWYAKHGNSRNGGICANLLLGGVQNTIGNIMRLSSNISRLGGIAKLGKRVRDDLRNTRKCCDVILELEVLSCFVEEGFPVTPYPILNNRRVPDCKVTVGSTDIFVEVTHNEWPRAKNFPSFGWKSKQGSKIIEKCLYEVEQLPDSECGAIVLNPPTLIDREMSNDILESMRGFLLPDLYSRISGIILANKLVERSGFIKASPILLVNGYAAKRCDSELERLAEALWKHP
jgi:hypothetical protein